MCSEVDDTIFYTSCRQLTCIKIQMWRHWWRRRKRMDQPEAAVVTGDGEAEDCASSIAVNPKFLTPMQSQSSFCGHSGPEAATTSASSLSSSSPFFSARIQTLSEQRSGFDSELEFQVKSSKSHWTELSVATSNSDGGEDEQLPNSVVFEKLKEHVEWGSFFRRQPYELEIGGKIAEGGQAEIFEALGTNKRDASCYKYESKTGDSVEGKARLVLKVFKEGFSLQDLQRLWPSGLASAAFPHRYFPRSGHGYGLCWALGAQLLDDGRFAFIFDRYWGDLRKVIDKRMLNRNGSPPFSLKQTQVLLSNIAQGMVMLHKCGLLHKDLKASNVLTQCDRSGDHHLYSAYIADFESTVGVVGTGFWRAPEVLLALKNGSLKPETFTQQSDVYSFAMTSYKIITGRIPFEGHSLRDCDIVLRGERPTLPDETYPEFKNLVRKCWHEDPSFDEIVEDLQVTVSNMNCVFRATCRARAKAQANLPGPRLPMALSCPHVPICGPF